MTSMLSCLTSALLLLTLVVFCYGDQWLMEGDFISQSEALQRRLFLESTNSSTSVSSSVRVTLSAPPGYKINCVLAAALHMNGDVSLVEGGVGSETATLAYKTRNGRPDLFFVLIESHADEAALMLVALEGNAAESTRVTIVYDRVKQWRSMILGGLGIGAENDTTVKVTDTPGKG